jgi:carboxymethylenebutenolidase
LEIGILKLPVKLATRRLEFSEIIFPGAIVMVQYEGVSRPLIYKSGDGETEIPGYLVVPDGDGPHPAVLILRGVAGPEDGYTEIARRLAAWGYVALLHGWKVRGDDPPDAPVYDDLEGAFDFLLSLDQVDGKRLVVFGFCRGGVHALMAARSHPAVRLVVIFHGFAFRPENAQPGAQPFDLAEGVEIPILVLHGTEDEQAPIEGMRRMEERMRARGKACAFKFYDGVRHGFAVRTHPGYDSDAAKQGFNEAKRFMEKHLQGRA